MCQWQTSLSRSRGRATGGWGQVAGAQAVHRGGCAGPEGNCRGRGRAPEAERLIDCCLCLGGLRAGVPTTRPSRVRCSFAANAGGVHALAFSRCGLLKGGEGGI